MARGQAIGSLFVDIGSQTASFEAGLQQASRKAQRFGQQVQRQIGRDLGGGFDQLAARTRTMAAGFDRLKIAIGGVVAALGVREIGAWANRMANASESAINLSSALGIPLGRLLELQGAFQLTEGSVEDASRVILQLSKVTQEALAGGEDAQKKFGALGISLTDLARRANDPVALLKLLADRFVAYRDGAQKSALFSELLGRGVEKLAPLLSQGAAGIERLVEQHHRLDPAAEQSTRRGDALSQELDRLAKTTTGLNNKLFELASPALTDATKNMGDFTSAVTAAINANEKFATGAVSGMLAGLKEIAKEAALTLVPLARLAQVMGAVHGFRASRLPGTTDDIIRQRSADALRGTSADEHDFGGLTIPMGIGGEWSPRARDRRPLPGTINRGKAGRTGGGGAERPAREIDNLFARIEDSSLMADRTLREVRQRLDEIGDTARDAAFVFQSSFERAFDHITEGTFKLRDAIGGLLKDLGRLLARLGFERLLGTGSRGGGLFGWLGDMLMPGMGGSNITTASGATLSPLAASIPIGGSLNIPGFATGGSFEIGGSGGIDSQLVALRGTPGEMVNITKGDRPMGGAAEPLRIELVHDAAFLGDFTDKRIVTRSGQIVQVAVKRSTAAVDRNFAGMFAKNRDRVM